MHRIRHEAGIYRDNVTEEVDVRGVAPRLGLVAPWPAGGITSTLPMPGSPPA